MPPVVLGFLVGMMILRTGWIFLSGHSVAMFPQGEGNAIFCSLFFFFEMTKIGVVMMYALTRSWVYEENGLD